MSRVKRIIEIEEEHIKELQDYCKGKPYVQLSFKIINSAFSSIAQSKPYEDSGDLISRKVIKGLISDKSIPVKFEEEKRGNWQRSSGVLLSDIYNIIDNAPTVSFVISPDYVTELQNLNKELIKQLEEAEKPQGEWIELRRGIHVTDYKCSCCGRTVRDDTGYDVSKDYPFCHCGADMRGGAE